MGNKMSGNTSSSSSPAAAADGNKNGVALPTVAVDEKAKYRSFPGSAILEKAFCGSIDTTDPSEYQNTTTLQRLVKRADKLCVSSPVSDGGGRYSLSFEDDDDANNSLRDFQAVSPHKKKACSRRQSAGVLLARALVNEVTDNPKTMKPAAMADREKKLLRAQAQAHRNHRSNNSSKPVGAAGPPHVLRSMAYACTGDDAHILAPVDLCVNDDAAAPYHHNNYDDSGENAQQLPPASPFRITLGLCLSRRSCSDDELEDGHPATITRQTAYDFNQLQDRGHKYVSSISQSGWKGGGGTAAPDNLHLPISVIDCPNQQTVDAVITALASGEIFIPHMQILPPERMTTFSNNSSSNDITVSFGCERNEQDNSNPEEWPNWCLEFMHNQLYEYFYSAGARWMPRPFQITLATGVRWKTVKHMNRYFSNAEKVLQAWREMGPQYLNPGHPPHVEGGATPEEVAHPHGIYLFRGNGVPTNYFGPNFEPPYTTKMTRSLLLTVLDKSYDKKRCEWTSTGAVPHIVEPVALLTAACGCGTSTHHDGFMAREVTTTTHNNNHRTTTSNIEQLYPRTHSEIEFGGGGSDEKENFDEKKSDDVLLQHEQPSATAQYHTTAEQDIVSRSSKFRLNNSRQQQQHGSLDEQHTTTTTANTPSVAHASVAESGTTVLHANVSSSGKNYKSPIALHNNNNNRLFSDEDFLNVVDSSSPAVKQSPREALEDKQNQNNNNERASNTTTMHTQAKMDREKIMAHYTMHPGGGSSPTAALQKSKSRTSSALEQSASLEYSTDGSSAFFTQDHSTLIGQHFEEPQQQQAKQQQQTTGTRHYKSNKLTIEEEEEEEESMLSLQTTATSSSAQSVVPTDEELYVIGWAKALDPNSGNYYYFTLDRARTVWENPLSNTSSVLLENGELPPPQQPKVSVDP